MTIEFDDMGFQQETHLDALNELLGGLPVRTLTGLFGPPGAGKTTTMYQTAVDYTAREERPAIIVDTEGSVHTYREWWTKFQQRFDLEDDEESELVYARYTKEDRGNEDSNEYSLEMPGDVEPDTVPQKAVVILDCRNIRGILHMHGRGVNINIKDKKMGILQDKDHWVESPFLSPIGKLVLDTGAGFLSYDSLSMPLKEIGIEQQNLPQRAEATSYWMGPAQTLFQELGLAGFAVMHWMKDPANQYDTPQFEGGKALGHTFKYVVEMREAKQKTQRKAMIYRHPAKGRYTEDRWLRFSKRGLYDVDKD